MEKKKRTRCVQSKCLKLRYIDCEIDWNETTLLCEDHYYEQVFERQNQENIVKFGYCKWIDNNKQCTNGREENNILCGEHEIEFQFMMKS